MPAPVVQQIVIAPASRLPVKSVATVEVEAGKGLVGDRYHGTRHRHVSVQSAESLAETAEILGHDFDPGLTRRNVTISAGVIPTRPGQRIRIGDVLLEVVRPAAPCRLMDEQIGDGARRALSGRAGAIFRALSSGTIAVGDPVDLDVAADPVAHG